MMTACSTAAVLCIPLPLEQNNGKLTQRKQCRLVNIGGVLRHNDNIITTRNPQIGFCGETDLVRCLAVRSNTLVPHRRPVSRLAVSTNDLHLLDPQSSCSRNGEPRPSRLTHTTYYSQVLRWVTVQGRGGPSAVGGLAAIESSAAALKQQTGFRPSRSPRSDANTHLEPVHLSQPP